MAGSLAHFLPLLILLCTHGVRSEGSNNTEAAALLQIKSGFTNGDAILSDWDSAAGSPCSWTGIQCENDSVAAIALQQMGLEGTITPKGWADLPNLQALSLHSNYLSGTLPKGWQLSDKVQLLYLFNNSLAGEPFPGWELPSQLLDLQLDLNNFTGSVPASLPKALAYLYLNNNSFAGTLPADWALPDSLQVLSLYNNQLSGALGFTLPPALTELSLFTNRFSGAIDQLELPDALQNVLLFNNSFTGSIPQQLPSNLKQLSISYNQLSGAIPADWRLPSGLQLLFLSANRLSGSLPDLLLPTSLTSLEFGNNSLTGTLPKFGFPESLLSLVLINNRLSGTLPDDWNLPMAAIELTNNSLTGTIPSNWTMPNLLYLSLSYNNLTGTLPSWDASPLTVMQVLPQKGDGLCGEVPPNPTFFDDEEKLIPGEPLNCTSDPQAPSPLPPPPSSAPSGDTGNKGSSSGSSSTVGVVVGVTVGCAALVAAALAFWWYVWSRRRASEAGSLKGDTSKAPSGANMGSKQSWPSNSAKAVINTVQDSACDVEDIVVMGSGATSAAGAAARTPSNREPEGSGSLEPAPTPPRDRLLELALREANSDDSGAASSPGGRLGNRQNLEHLKMWLVEFSDIELIKQIGEGSYGRVYLGKWKEMLVACKILLNTALDVYTDDTTNLPAAQAVSLSNPVLQNLHKEAGIMAALRHPNIMSFLGVCPSPPCVLSEFCSRGSLADVLRAARQSPQLAAKLDWPRRLSMMMDCAKGLLYLHGRNPPIIHRDLKAANLLIDVNWKAKVADFNLSRIVAEGSILSSAQATNPRWLAPEVLNGEPASQQSDVFSYGMVLWECLTWSVPFASENHWTLVKFVSNGGRPEIPPLEALPGQDTASFQGLGVYIDLIQRCWVQDPADRPSFADIVAGLRSMLAPTLKQVRGPTPKERGQSGASEPAASHVTQQTSASAGSEPVPMTSPNVPP